MNQAARPLKVVGVPDFWERVSAADERLLVLDYDGTLAPFRENRMEALPVPGAMEAVRSIRDSGRTRVAMLTGRPLEELLELIGNLGIPMAGSHGFEFLMEDGTIERGRLSPAQEELLRRAEAEAREAAPSAGIERKPASVGVHTRGMPHAESERLHRAMMESWSRGAGETGLEVRRFSGGVELRLKSAHKGIAVRRLLEDTGENTLCVCIGDDETDEDAFAALPGSGIGIKVGPAGVATRAQGRLDDPAGVRRLLEEWLEVTTG